MYYKIVAAAAKSRQSCPTLCDPIDGSLPGSLGFSRQEHWSGLPFPSPMHESEKWKWSHSVMSDSATPWTEAYQAPPSMPLPSLKPGHSRSSQSSSREGRFLHASRGAQIIWDPLQASSSWGPHCLCVQTHRQWTAGLDSGAFSEEWTQSKECNLGHGVCTAGAEGGLHTWTPLEKMHNFHLWGNAHVYENKVQSFHLSSKEPMAPLHQILRTTHRVL